MTICARIGRASDFVYLYWSFNDYNELANYMKKQYHRWIIRFDDDSVDANMFPVECNEKVGLIMYDDYIE